MTAPNGLAQLRLINTVQSSVTRRVNDKKQITLEAHGTGTALGDPIEVGAAVRAMSAIDTSCASSKANVGHLEAVAAGIGAVLLICVPLSLLNVSPNS